MFCVQDASSLPNGSVGNHANFASTPLHVMLSAKNIVLLYYCYISSLVLLNNPLIIVYGYTKNIPLY